MPPVPIRRAPTLPENLRDILYRAMVSARPPWLRYARRGRHLLQHGVAFLAHDLPGPAFNKVIVLSPSPPLEQLLELGTEFYAGAPGGYGILVEADAGHPVEAELRARGWRIEEDEPTFVMPGIPTPPELPVG